MANDKPLTAKSTIGTWLKHPRGGAIVRGYLARAGVDERALAPVKLLPLEKAVPMSGGRLTQAMVDDLVAQANRPD